MKKNNKMSVWSESSLCTQWVAKDPSFLHADSKDWSDWAEAQADLNLRWAHSHFVGFVMSRLIYYFLFQRWQLTMSRHKLVRMSMSLKAKGVGDGAKEGEGEVKGCLYLRSMTWNLFEIG